MTEKLYYTDSHLYEFSAVAVDIFPRENGCGIVLDRTAFFPEGGGQPADEGFIGGAEIFDVRENDGVIIHCCRTEPDFGIGDRVDCSLNAALRFSRMQSHSGEHILSGVVHNMYGAENVGFHMLDLVMTVDFDKPLTKEQLAAAEKEANGFVYKNVAVTTEILSGDKLLTLQYRSKLDLKENVRLVTIEGCDVCACCAPHVSRTGEIGVIKILGSISHRGGVRVTLICGNKAFEDYSVKHAAAAEISNELKVPVCEAVPAFFALIEKQYEEKRRYNELKQKLFDYIYSGLEPVPGNLVIFVPDFSPDELRELADLCRDKAGGVFAVFSGDDVKGYAFAVSSVGVKLKALSRIINSALNGRGGGRDEMLQGRAICDKNTITSFFEESELQNLCE